MLSGALVARAGDAPWSGASHACDNSRGIGGWLVGARTATPTANSFAPVGEIDDCCARGDEPIAANSITAEKIRTAFFMNLSAR